MDVNEAAAKRLGKTVEDMVGSHFKKYIHPDLAESRWEYIKRAIDCNEVVEFEDERDGIYFQHKLFPLYSDGKVKRVVVNSQDITNRKNGEKALIRVNSYNRSLIEASIDPFVTVDPDGKITDINDALESATGYKRKQVIGTIFLFTSPVQSMQRKDSKEYLTMNFLKIIH